MVILLATALIVLPILALSQFTSHARVDEIDAWLFAYYGREMLDGRVLYADLWDNKPPGIFWLNALGMAFSGGSLTGVRVLCALASCGAVVLVFSTARRLYGWSAAGISAVLASLYLNIWLYHVGCNRPSTFFVVTELACVGLYCAALTRPKRWTRMLLAAGVCGGLGVCLKQTALAASSAVVLHTVYLAVRGRLSVRAALGQIACFAAGWCLVVTVSGLAILLTSDAEAAWYAVVGFNALYFAPGGGSSWWPQFFALEHHLRALSLPAILALATLAQPLLRRFVGQAPERDDDTVGARPPGLLFLLWMWMLCAIYLALVGPHKRLAYYGVALPPLVMLSAHGVYLLLRSGRRVRTTQPAYHLVVGALWVGYMMIFPLHQQAVEAAKQHYHCYVEQPNAGYVAAVEAIRRHTQPDDSIFVFGYGPKLYWDAQRSSAIRYIGTEKAEQLGARGQPILDEVSDALMQARPKAILVNADGLKNMGDTSGLDASEL
ncbi:MAG: glycosyltransferase family 39 protein, partial [bacterium]|nr:glycosyltransferase family 39 protein [bacterium]